MPRFVTSLIVAVLAVTAPPAGAVPPAPPVPSAPAPTPAQAEPGDTLRDQEPDSSTLHDRARSAQRRFERRRRQALPRTADGMSYSSCDEVIGRFCLRFDTGDDWRPEPDPPEVLQARDDLLDELEEIAARIPGDGWILGQRVQYLGEEGRWGEALEAVGSCEAPAEGWWCHALRGYTLHRSDRYEEAERAFRAALETMDEERREQWLDPEIVLDRDAHSTWDDASEEDRDLLRDRLWTLADPLFLVPGNDRLTEHFARHTASWIREDARNPYGLSWGWDLTRLVVRYGSEVGWERTRPRVGSLRPASVVGHHHPESRQYLPPGEVFSDPAAADPGEWELEVRRPRTSYAPPYAPRLEAESFQIARFRRGRNLVVVAGFRLPPDTAREEDGYAGEGASPPAPRGEAPGAPDEEGEDARLGAGPAGPVQAGLFLVDEDAGDRLRTVRTGRERGGLRLRAPPGRYLLSVEVWSPGKARAGRARGGVRLVDNGSGAAAISDLLLMDAGDGVPRSLDEAVDRARPELRACVGETLAIGWETYGAELRRETLEFRLLIERTDRGLLQRAGEWLGLTGSPEPVSVRWTEPGPDTAAPAFRAVDLTLPHDLEEGTYRVRLRVEPSDGPALEADRSLAVEEPLACASFGSAAGRR